MSGLKLSLGSMGIQPTEQVKQAQDGGEEEVEEEDAFDAPAQPKAKPNYDLKMFDKLNPGKGGTHISAKLGHRSIGTAAITRMPVGCPLPLARVHLLIVVGCMDRGHGKPAQTFTHHIFLDLLPSPHTRATMPPPPQSWTRYAATGPSRGARSRLRLQAIPPEASELEKWWTRRAGGA